MARKIRKDKGVSHMPEFERPEPIAGETWEQYQQRLAKLRATTTRAARAARAAHAAENRAARAQAKAPLVTITTDDKLALLNRIADNGRDRGWLQGENGVKLQGLALRRCLDEGYLTRRHPMDRRLYLSNGGILFLRDSGRMDVDYWGY